MINIHDRAKAAAQRDDLTPAVRFFQGLGSALAFMLVVAAFVGWWIIT